MELRLTVHRCTLLLKLAYLLLLSRKRLAKLIVSKSIGCLHPPRAADRLPHIRSASEEM